MSQGEAVLRKSGIRDWVPEVQPPPPGEPPNSSGGCSAPGRTSKQANPTSLLASTASSVNLGPLHQIPSSPEAPTTSQSEFGLEPPKVLYLPVILVDPGLSHFRPESLLSPVLGGSVPQACPSLPQSLAALTGEEHAGLLDLSCGPLAPALPLGWEALVVSSRSLSTWT